MGVQFLYPRLPHLKTVAINFNASGDATVIAAIASTRILVHRLWLVVAGTANLTFKDGASNSLSGPIPIAPNGGITFDVSGEPWFTTALGNAFILNTDAGIQVSGMVYYATTT